MAQLRGKSLWGGCLAMGLLASACHANVLNLLTGQLAFSSPADPTALTQSDAGVVQIDFGSVAVGGTRTLVVDAVSLAGSLELGALTPIRSDPEFNLPLIPGTEVGSTPVQITVGFSPTSLGSKTDIVKLTYSDPATEVVTIELTGQGVPNGLTVVPDPVDFGQVEINQFQSISVTITDNRSVPATLVVGPLENQGSGAGPFTIGSPTSTALAPGASATLSAIFGPTVVGPATPRW